MRLNKTNVAYFVMVAVIATIGMGTVVHATEGNDTTNIAIAKDAFNSGAAITAGTGALAGVILSISRVIGKNLDAITSKTPIDPATGQPATGKLAVELEALDIGKLALTVAVGVIVGFALPYFHIGLDATFAGDFVATFLVSQFITPLFRTIRNRITPSSTQKKG